MSSFGPWGGGPSKHCYILKISLFINQSSHKIALFTWFGLFSIHFKAYEVTLNLSDGRSAVGGRPKLSNMSQVFFCALPKPHCIRTQCETKSMGWWDDALLFIFNISAFDSRLRNCTSPQSQDWFLQNSGKTKISWEMFEMKPHPRSKVIFDNLFREYQGLLMIREVRGESCPSRPCPLRGVGGSICGMQCCLWDSFFSDLLNN